MLFRHLFAIPNVISNSDALPKWWQPVNLGLDLQGGSNLLLEVKVDDVIKERMSSIEDSARQILRENKIRYQNLNAGADSVKVKIENANSRNKAANLFRKIDDGIQATENADGEIEIKYSDVELNKLKMKIVDQSIEIVRRRIDELGTKEPVIQSQGVDRIVVQLPGLQNPEYVKTLLGKTAKMSFHLVDSRSSAAEARRGKLSASSRLIQGSEGETYVIGRKPVVSGENLVDAQPSFQEGEAVVSFKFNSLGGKKFGEVTKTTLVNVWPSFWTTKSFRLRPFKAQFWAAAALSAATLLSSRPMTWPCCCAPVPCPLRWRFWKKERLAPVWVPTQSAKALSLPLSV